MHDPSATDSTPIQELLTPDEVAARFKVSRRTVLRWVEAGEVPSIKIGGTVRIPSDKLREMIDAILERSA